MTPTAQAWQKQIWDTAAEPYAGYLEPRIAPVHQAMLDRAKLQPGDRVLDIGCGAGALSMKALDAVAPNGTVTGIDLSSEMIRLAARRMLDKDGISFIKGRAERLPITNQSMDVVLASLSLMFVLDREAAAREIARVLAPGGRLIASILGGPDDTDIVRFQRIASTFGPEPPAKGAGPGSLADPQPFLDQLRAAGINASVDLGEFRFSFENLNAAWNVLAVSISARLEPPRREAALRELADEFWGDPSSPREFKNRVQYLTGTRS